MGHVVLLASLHGATGNFVSASRLRAFLTYGGHECSMLDANSFSSAEELIKWHETQKTKPNLYVGLHAYRAGRLLLNFFHTSYIIIFGGTDINEHVQQADKLQIMQNVCDRATFLVCFTDAIRDRAKQYFKSPENKLKVISPSVVPPNEEKAKKALRQFLAHQEVPETTKTFKAYMGIPSEDKMFILPCGIRAVKDPMFLMDSFVQQFQCATERWHLVIIGPVLDKEYFDRLKEGMNGKRGVCYHPNLPQDVLFAALMESEAIVNSSVSEGLSNALLEAMYLQVPIIARNIEGNRNFLTHQQTALLYDTAEDFCECVVLLRECKKRLTANALAYVTKNHSPELEQSKYRANCYP